MLKHGPAILWLEGFAFYERDKRADAIMAAGENARYGGLLLTKGVVG